MVSDELASRFDLKVEVVERRGGSSWTPQNNPVICYSGAASPLWSSPVALLYHQGHSGGGGASSSHEALGAHGGVTPPLPPHSTPSQHPTPSRQPTPSETSIAGGSPLRDASSPVLGAASGVLLCDDSELIDASFLRSIGVDEKYLQVFEEQEFKDVGDLKRIRKDDWKDLKIPMGPRNRILQALGIA